MDSVVTVDADTGSVVSGSDVVDVGVVIETLRDDVLTAGAVVVPGTLAVTDADRVDDVIAFVPDTSLLDVVNTVEELDEPVVSTCADAPVVVASGVSVTDTPVDVDRGVEDVDTDDTVEVPFAVVVCSGKVVEDENALVDEIGSVVSTVSTLTELTVDVTGTESVAVVSTDDVVDGDDVVDCS